MTSDLDKIGVKSITPFVQNGRWVFEYEGAKYDLAPAGMTEMIFSPLIMGVDQMVANAAKKKNISNPENGFTLLFSDGYFPNADVKLDLIEPKFDGWLYSIEELNLKGVMPGMKVWICPYMGFFYNNESPKVMYIKVEEKSNEIHS